jgi:hypothetical protein
MPDPIVPGADPSAPVAPVVAPVVAPAAPPVAAAPAPAPQTPPAVVPAPIPSAQEPGYIAAIKKDERRKVLKSLGLKVGKDDDVDAAINAFSSKILSRKDENKLLRDAVGELSTEKATLTGRATSLDEAVTSLLATEISLIPDANRAAVQAALTGDSASQLKQLAALKALGVKFSAPAPVPPVAPVVAPVAPVEPATPPAVPTVPGTPPAPIAAPVTSSPPAPGPVPTSPDPADIKAQFKQLRSSNNKTGRMLAAVMAIQNGHLLLPDDIA